MAQIQEVNANIYVSDSNPRNDAIPSIPQQLLSDEDLTFTKSNIDLLPANVKTKMVELETALEEGEITQKGFKKKASRILLPHLKNVQNAAKSKSEEYFEPPLESLPQFVKEQLKQLVHEFNEDEITKKGYAKRREKILAPFMLKEPPLSKLPKKVQKEITELLDELKEGDITEKGYKKKRAKLVTPYLTRVNGWPRDSTADSNKTDLATRGKLSRVEKKEEMFHATCIQIMDGNEKLFKCSVCDEVFKQAQSFSGHCRLHRTGKTKAYKCQVCNSSYTTRSHLKFHMYKHNGNYPYNCDFCGKGFAGKSQYRYHVLRHSGQLPFTCKDCGGRYWKKRNLDVHCEKHRTEDAPGFQKCAHCPAMYESLEDLENHLYEHEDDIEPQATMVPTKKKDTPGSVSSNDSKSEDAMEEDIGGEDEEDVLQGDFDIKSEQEIDNNNRVITKDVDSFT